MWKSKRIETVACSNLAAIEQQLYCNYTVIIQELDNSNAQVLLALNKSMSNSQAVPETIKNQNSDVEMLKSWNLAANISKMQRRQNQCHMRCWHERNQCLVR